MVFRVAPSAFCRNSRLPLSSMMQMVTWTLRFAISASAAAAIVFSAARFKYLREGRSAAEASRSALKHNMRSFSMGNMIPEFKVEFFRGGIIAAYGGGNAGMEILDPVGRSIGGGG